METYSIYFRQYANAERTKVQYIDADKKTRTVSLSIPGVLILALQPQQLLTALIKLAPYGIQRIEYMHPCDGEVTEEITTEG